MKKQYITDSAWNKILKFFMNLPKIHKKCKKKLKRFIEAIHWIVKSGAQWRLLPKEFGNWNTIFKRFKRWSNKKILKKLMHSCIENPDLEYVMIDSTVVRAHACAAGKGKQKEQGLGRSVGGFTSKVHAKVDALGNPLKFIVTSGGRSDFKEAANLLSTTSKSYVLGDKGYDSDIFRKQIKQHYTDIQFCSEVLPSRVRYKNQ